MQEHVFIDSSYWIALLDKRDQNFEAAKSSLHPLLKNYRVCLSDFVQFETLTYLNCSLKRYDLAMKFLTKTEAP